MTPGETIMTIENTTKHGMKSKTSKSAFGTG